MHTTARLWECRTSRSTWASRSRRSTSGGSRTTAPKDVEFGRYMRYDLRDVLKSSGQPVGRPQLGGDRGTTTATGGHRRRGADLPRP
jgi:hypothetical protein